MSTTRVEHLLTLPPHECGAALLEIPESQWFERKSGRVTAKTAAKTAIAFANAEGGVLIVGASNGVIDGVRPQLINDLQQMALDHTEPPVPMDLDLIQVETDGQQRTLAVVRVRVADRVVHATKDDTVLLRVGDENRQLNYSQRRELVFDRGQSVYERTPLDHSFDAKLLDGYTNAVGASDPMRLLRSRGLVLQDDRTTVGSALLFGSEPQAQLPHAYVRILRHQGRIARTGTRQQLLLDERVEGPLPEQLTQARAIIKANIPTRQALGIDGLFGPVGIIPEHAWLEGLVNAVIHRSYSSAGDYIRVTIFDDCIEIESPGRFPGIVDLADPRSVNRFARNPRIARVLADLRFGQELGEGIRRIFEEMRLAGLADPEYQQTAGSVQLRLTAASIDRELDKRLPRGWHEAMQTIRAGERVSTGEVSSAIGRSRPATIKLLRAMEEARLIKWIGTSDRDPRAYWTPRLE